MVGAGLGSYPFRNRGEVREQSASFDSSGKVGYQSGRRMPNIITEFGLLGF